MLGTLARTSLLRSAAFVSREGRGQGFGLLQPLPRQPNPGAVPLYRRQARLRALLSVGQALYAWYRASHEKIRPLKGPHPLSVGAVAWSPWPLGSSPSRNKTPSTKIPSQAHKIFISHNPNNLAKSHPR